MARLEPFLKAKGYPQVESEELGSKAVTLLSSASYHLVLFDLFLGDVQLREFFLDARQRQADASYILCASPSDAEMIVSGLVLGADTYVPLPPDEDELFHVLERHGAAAMARKNANPDAQPGVSLKVQALEEELAAARAQLADLEEQNALFDAEMVRLNKLLESARAEAQKAAPAEAAVPPGHTVVPVATLEELESRATFAEFLESENDEIKKERDALLARLKALGEGIDDDEDAFDEPTGAMLIDVVSSPSAPREDAVAASPMAEPESGEGAFEEELLIEDDDDAPATGSGGGDGGDGDGDELFLVTDGDDFIFDDGAAESGAAALAALVEEKPAARSAPPPMSPSKAALPFEAPPPTVVEPELPPPPVGDADDDFDDFEDVNTDALLRLAGDLSKEAPSGDDLDALLASLEED